MRRTTTDRHDRGIHDHVSGLRDLEDRDDADRRLPILLRVHQVQNDTSSEAGRLLRLLHVRFGTVPGDSGRRPAVN